MLSKKVIFGGSFDPPGSHHLKIALGLREYFEEVIVYPCGPRPDKPSVNEASRGDRSSMCLLTFRDLSGIRLDLADLEQGVFTRTHALQKRFSPEGEIWHAVGSDIIKDGRRGMSAIHRRWERCYEMWRDLNFAVIVRPEIAFDSDDLPPHSMVIGLGDIRGSSTEIRRRCAKNLSLDGWVAPGVSGYISELGLYGKKRGK